MVARRSEWRWRDTWLNMYMHNQACAREWAWAHSVAVTAETVAHVVMAVCYLIVFACADNIHKDNSLCTVRYTQSRKSDHIQGEQEGAATRYIYR